MKHLTILLATLSNAYILGCVPDQNDSLPEPTPTVAPDTANTTTDTLESSREAAAREFKFTYAGAITELEAGDEVSIWLPVAGDTHEQQILDREIDVPGEYTIGEERAYGNQILHFTAKANEQGEVPFQVIYHLTRSEALQADSEKITEAQAAAFTLPSKLVPVDQNLSGQILGDTTLANNSLTAGRQIYDAVNNRMKYDKPEGGDWGRGDSVWACGNGFGNCTDFHSLFISICREQKIPARFEIGFPIASERGEGEVGGYHCWAKFAANETWVPVDISEADKDPSLNDYYYGNLTENRITFSVGRDLTLTPEQQGDPVNFLVYPYAEVAGTPHTTFRKGFRYEDIQ